MNKDDVRIGLKKYSLIKNPIKWFQVFKYRRKHKKLHNDNDLFYPTQPPLLEAIIKAFDIQIKNQKIDNHAYYEFGVFKGFSLWFAQMYANHHNIPKKGHLPENQNFYFYGFDSFEGLPKSKIDGMKPAFGKGHYTSSFDFVINKFRNLDVDFDKLSLFKGFYSKDFFKACGVKAHKNEIGFLPISICVIDVDVYESCVPVLEFIKDKLVPKSILLFDDYNLFGKSDEHGERKAFLEFKLKYPNFKFRHLFDFGYGGSAFEVIEI